MLKKIWPLILAVILFAGCAGSNELSKADTKSALPFDSRVATDTLDNGLTYFVRENKKPDNRIALRLVVNAGSLMEEEDQQGLAHLIEHMAFNGTEHFAKQELVDYFEMVGMDFGPEINAYTSFDETVYMLRIPADDPEILDKALLVLHDWATSISFDPEEVDKERGVVTEEWRLGRGAQGRIQDQQFPVLFDGSRYADRLPIGHMDVVANAPVQRLKDFYHKWYRPELMSIIVVGDVDQDTVIKKIKEQFDYPSQGGPERPSYPVPDNKDININITTDPETSYNQVEVYYKQDPKDFFTRGDYRETIKQALQFRMLNKRLAEILQEENPPFLDVSTGSQRFVRNKDLGYLIAIAPSGGIDTSLRALLEESERVKRYGFTQAELDREKNNLLSSMRQYYLEKENIPSSSLADELKRHYLFGEPIPGIEVEYQLYKDFLPGISLKEMNQFVSNWLDDVGPVVLISAPEGEMIPTESDVEGIFNQVKSEDLKPYALMADDRELMENIPTPGAILDEQKYPATGITRWTLSNGAQVIVKPTDFMDNQVLFYAVSPGGSSLVKDRDYLSSQFAMAIASQSGLNGFNSIELQNLLAGKSVKVNSWIHDYYEGVSGQYSPEDGTTFFQLVNLSFTKQMYTKQAFNSLMNRYSSFLENKENDPQTIFSDRLRVLTSGGHFRYRPLTSSLLSEVKLEQAQKIGEERFANAADFTFFFVGNIDMKELKEEVSTYIASLPATTKRESFVDQNVNFPKGITEETIHKGLEPQSRVHLTFSGDFTPGKWQKDLFEAARHVLALRLHEKIREDMSGTYGVRVSGAATDVPNDHFSLNIDFGCEPGREEELTAAVFDEIKKLASGVVQEKNIVKVKEGLIRDQEKGLKENSYWLSQMIDLELDGKDFDVIMEESKIIDQITPANISRMIKTYINPDHYVKLILTPEDK
ncbi:M16 family metallopeptidase [Spirochaeta cellobiosiphila]|uniref:M16 family metallopeptidase n=1 Tax=Spirochaeta cellobiosiphila TaxID=504483 RepID=UPI0003FF66EC|nr:M16 family metallopeptidase [Spirochaeta cellobiosiphila]